MKWLIAALLAIALSGCTAPEEDGPDLLGSCPQWIAGPEFETARNESQEIVIEANASVPASYQGYPLDKYLLRMSADAPVEVRARAMADDRRLELHVQEGNDVQTRPFLVVEDEVEAQVYLSPVAHGSTPSPSSLRLSLQGEGGFQVHVTPFYRVCGAVLDTPST